MNLDSLIEKEFRTTEVQKKAFKKIGLKTIENLLFYFPSRYENTEELKNIKNLQNNDKTIIYAKVKSINMRKAYVKKIPMTEAILEDTTGTIKAIWFNQPYIAKMLAVGSSVKLQGTITERNRQLCINNPEYKIVAEIPLDIDKSLFNSKNSKKDNFIYPIYSEKRGLNSGWIYHKIQKIFSENILDELEDPIPEKVLKKYNLPTLKTALIWIHSPQKKSDAVAARKRFAFEEIFFIQLSRAKLKKEYQENPSFKIKKTKKEMNEFIKRFPFTPTLSQKKSINQILEDFGKNFAMNRLLEGDVGSGKTAVAASAVYAVTTTKPNGKNYGNLQTAYMVPTEILAKQHFESFIKYFSHLNINIGLITSSGCCKFPSKVDPTDWTKISRAQLLKWVEDGSIPILIGTHSLISKSVKFKSLAYVIIDEQHRFGLMQRKRLTQKSDSEIENLCPHLLSMTATPIPRTLALSIYGDLDLTLLDEMPHGRKPIITNIITPSKRNESYEKIRKELKKGRQMYVICPRIDEPDPDKATALRLKSVKAEAKRLKKEIFPEYEIGILHSKMKPNEKEEIMNDFVNKKISILVATSVIEVGVNVPNATVIILEGAERFGLAQLHQLRGRVIRSNHQSYCYVFCESKTKKTIERLNALKTAKNGFELSEFDLEIRGPGELIGNKQWGISDLGMEAIKNIKMLEASRKEAQQIIEKDPKLKKYPLIKERVVKTKELIHFE
ncbi:MAG: ATP-dependent DNA helicase RecG [Candidatus Pacebacteria bacterium]|nr:ATP-dependent DNA helicase RecG [Candidatus Paceibacterota bacterium]